MYRWPLILAVLTCTAGYAQDTQTREYDHRLYLSARLNIGTFWTPLEQGDTLPQWSTGFGGYVSLEPYLTWQYRRDWSVALGGGIQLYNMNYSTSYENYGFNYNLSYIGLKAQGTVKKYFEIDRSTVFAGIGSGVAFHGYDDIARQEHVFEVSAYSVYDIPWFISPEFGFMHKDGKKQISISGHYLWYPGSDPFLFGELKQPANTATTAYRGSYLGLAITWDFLIPRKEKPIDIIEPVDPEIVDRDAIHTKTANMKPGKLTIKVWDHLTVDNDTISILFNGEIVLQEHGLTARKKTVKVDLEPGVNYLTVLAHNEGEQSPNSCAMIIRSGSDEFEYILNSSMMRNEGIAIHVSDD